jgi:predicted DsbA family dithiol-disulfide isomerase
VTRAIIEVFAEVACPFTHVGLRRIVTTRSATGRTQPLLRVRAWPLELVNGAPLAPDLIAQHVDELRSQVDPRLFRGFDPAALPATSFPAFELVAAAYARGDAAGEQVSLAVRDALFEEGRDVSDPSVLAEIGRSHGLADPGPDATRSVLADYEAGKRLGVRGSPEYFLDGDGYFCPALQMREIDGTLEIENASEAFDAFVAECFR